MEREGDEDKRNNGLTTSENGQGRAIPKPSVQHRTEKYRETMTKRCADVSGRQSSDMTGAAR